AIVVNRFGEDHTHLSAVPHRADPPVDRYGTRTRGRRAPETSSRAESKVRLSSLFVLDVASTAALVLLPLPLIITANAAVGRRWAHFAVAILAGVSAGITFLLGALDAAG